MNTHVPRGKPRKFTVRILIVALVGVFSGCQTDGVSLNQARQIAAGIQGPRFEAPPNSIADILTLVQTERPDDKARLSEVRAVADAPTPKNANMADLARFHAGRADAARRLGRSDAALADYLKALELSKGAGSVSNNEKAGWQFSAGLFFIDNGDLIKGLRTIEEANALLRPDIRILQLNELGQALGRVMGFEAMIATVYARLGDNESAQQALARARDVEGEFSSLISYGQSNNALTADDVIGAEMAFGVLRIGQGRVAAISGNLNEGIGFVRNAIQRLSKYEAGIAGLSRDLVATVRVDAHNELAGMLIARGEIVEAEVMARQGLVSSIRNLGRYNQTTSGALAKLGEVLLADGRYGQAEEIVRLALADLAQSGAHAHARASIEAKGALAKALAARGQWNAALSEFRELKTQYEKFAPGYADHAMSADSGFAVTALFGGAAELARDAAERELQGRLETFGPDDYRTVEATAFLGAAVWRAGRQDEARALLSKSVPILAAVEGNARRPYLSRVRTEAIIAAYLAANGIENGGVGEAGSAIETAFRLAEGTRTGKLEAALNAAAARATARALPGLSDLIRQKDDVQLKADAANRILSEAVLVPGISRDDPKIVAMRSAARQFAAASVALQSEIDSRFPEYRALASPPPSDFATTRQALGGDEALISIFDGAQRTYVWAIPRHGAARLAAIDMSSSDIAAAITNIRRALAPGEVATIGDIPQFDLAAAYDFYRRLLLPVEPAFKDAKHLTIVATGVIPSLPLAVLPTSPARQASETGLLFSSYRSVPWLIRRHSSSYVPSAATLVALRRLPPAAGTKPFVGFGDPIFDAGIQTAQSQAVSDSGSTMRGVPIRLRASPPISDRQVTLADLPRLADTAQEITEVARALEANLSEDVYLGQRANEENVLRLSTSGALANYKVISFATHGLVSGELSGLRQPALALSNPRAVPGAQSDGLLTLDEVLGLKLDADWAILSACNTGSSDGTSGEALSGLGQAFFFAGSKALLVSNWPVHSDATAALMIGSFRAQPNAPSGTRAGSVGAAMLGLIDRETYRLGDGREAFSYAHPLFWAPFSVIGDGGGVKRSAS